MKILKVLIADDEEMLRDLYEMIIESEFSCQITKVANGAEAIETLKTSPDFDLIISDYNMPEANGGQIYLFNKTQTNIPFFLFSGGELHDYVEFKDFTESNQLNHFFGKPFDDRNFLDAIAQINTKPSSNIQNNEDQYIKIMLSYFAKHSTTASEVYIKLGDNKFTKIISLNEENIAEKDLLDHYSKKGIDYIYLEKEYYKHFLNELFTTFHQNIQNERKLQTYYQISGVDLQVSFDGLSDVGISSSQIEKVNEEIEVTINSLLNNPSSKDLFLKLCKSEGYYIAHSMLIIYVAGRICQETTLNFSTTMKKICTAAFFHDFTLFELGLQDLNLPVQYDEMKPESITNESLLKQILEHPISSTNFLSKHLEVIEDTKKIIMEHHEMPNGNGYPRKLTASTISPLSCLFILSQEITFCLIRNNFSKDRVHDFLLNIENDFNQGNFSKFFEIAKAIF